MKPVEVVESISGDSLLLHLLSCESWIFVKEKLDRKTKTKNKKANYALQHARQTVGVCGWRASWIFYDGGPYYTKTSVSICRTNQQTGLYTTRTSVMKELMLCYLHVFIEIYSLIMKKIIDIYASKYQWRMFLINPLCKV